MKGQFGKKTTLRLFEGSPGQRIALARELTGRLSSIYAIAVIAGIILVSGSIYLLERQNYQANNALVEQLLVDTIGNQLQHFEVAATQGNLEQFNNIIHADRMVLVDLYGFERAQVGNADISRPVDETRQILTPTGVMIGEIHMWHNKKPVWAKHFWNWLPLILMCVAGMFEFARRFVLSTIRKLVLSPLDHVVRMINTVPADTHEWHEGIGNMSRHPDFKVILDSYEKVYQRIHTLAVTDSLSGLGNRYGFEQYVEMLNADDVACLVLIDIDHLKYINDHYGHSIGDRIIAQFGERLSNVTRGFAKPFRIGGDEFALVCRRGKLTEAQAIELVKKCASSPFKINNDIGLDITLSIGIVPTLSNELNLEEIVRQADIALYSAKKQGRNRSVIFTPDMQGEVNQIAISARMIRKFVDKEMMIPFHFQPIVDFATNEVIGYESLLRVRDDDDFLLSPPLFVKACEAMGFAGHLNEKTCESVFNSARNKISANQFVTINLTSAQLIAESAVDTVSSAAREYGLRARQIVIEVNEAQHLEDPIIRSILHDFRSQNIRVAIDDFGSGYSSLRCLHSLPLDFVKLDKAFVRQSKDDKGMLRSLRTICADLDLKVIVEGIETEPEFKLCESLGFEFAQGYFIGRPKPIGLVCV